MLTTETLSDKNISPGEGVPTSIRVNKHLLKGDYFIEHWKNLSLNDIDGELWKDIPEYEGYYSISSFGRVKSLSRTIAQGRTYKDRILVQCLNGRGYLQVALSKNSPQKIMRVHRIVAGIFIPNPENKPCINHIIPVRTLNTVENLEWCTYKENSDHAYKLGRMCQNPVLQLDKDGEVIKRYESMRSAEKDGFYNTAISMVCMGKRPHHRGFKWKYA